MKQMWILAWAGLKSRKRSSMLLLSTIVLSVVFLVVMGLIGSSSLFTVDTQNKDLYGEQKVVAWNTSKQQMSQIKQQTIWDEIGQISVYGVITSTSDTLLGIGAMDEQARKLGHIRLAEGKMPQAPNEIVLEKSVYKHIGNKKYAVGDTITLNITSICKEEKRPFHFEIVGFMENYTAVWENTYTYNSTESSSSPMLASFLLSEQGAKELSSESMDVLLLGSASNSYISLRDSLPKDITYSFNYSTYPGISYFGGLGEESLGVIGISALIGSIILICMIVILLNGFLMSVDKRKRQFALLRSIGATKKQAYAYIFCEAIVLMCIGIPIGIGIGVSLSFGAVKLFSGINQSPLIYHFNGWILLIAVIVCVLCVCVAVLIPAMRASKSAPIVEVRPVYFVRKRKSSEKRKGLALRPLSLMLLSMRKSKVKMALTVIVFSLVIVVYNTMAFADIVNFQAEKVYQSADVTLFSNSESGVTNDRFRINQKKLYPNIPVSIFDKMNGLPYMQYTSSSISPYFYCRIPFSQYNDYLNGYFRYDYKMLGIKNWETWGQYNYQFEDQKKYGYTDQEFLIQPNITMMNDDLLQQLNRYVIDGIISSEAIERGEELVLCVPDYVLCIIESKNNLHTSVQLIKNGIHESKGAKMFKNDFWKVGDFITFTWVESINDKSIIREKKIRIGALVKEMPPLVDMPRNVFGMAVGEKALSNLTLPFEISNFNMYFHQNADIEDAELEIRQIASQSYPLATTSTQTEQTLSTQKQRRTTMSIMSMLTICLLALGFLGLMNTVCSRIYNRTHEIGLLRCIGMTKGQILRMFIYEGALFGIISSLAGSAFSCLYIFPKFEADWISTAMPIHLLFSCAICLLLSIITIFIPARDVLKSNPTETIRMNI